MPGPIRCGCSFLLLLIVVACGACGAAAWFATRDTGPGYSDGVYTVQTAAGTRVEHISLAAAQRFDDKQRPDLTPQGLARLQLQGIDFTEEEVNSRLAEQLLQEPVETGRIHVDRVFLELHPQGSIAYAYTTMFGLHVTLSSKVTFSVVNSTARVQLSSPRAGRLPVDLPLRFYLKQTNNTAQLERLLELALPPQVTAISPREGALHVAVNVLRQARTSPPAPLLPERGA